MIIIGVIFGAFDVLQMGVVDVPSVSKSIAAAILLFPSSLLFFLLLQLCFGFLKRVSNLKVG